MNILLRVFIVLFSIGCFFSTALCNIGFLGVAGLLILELFFDDDFRQCFAKFHRTHRIWIPTIFILLLSFLEVRWNSSDFAIGLNAFCKYLRFTIILVLIPGFLYHKRSVDFLFHMFGLTAFVWCIFHLLYGNAVRFFICSIHISVFISCLCCYYTINILRRKSRFLNLIRLLYFAVYLLCINTEKTGVVATGLAEFLALFVAVLAVNRKNMREILLSCAYVVAVFSSAWYISFHKNAPIAQRTRNFMKTSSVRWRIKMIKEGQDIVKNNKIYGVGTGGYRKELVNRDLDYLGSKDVSIPKNPHPHNEWLLWLIQWGIFGFIGLVVWFGYNFIYFTMGFRLKAFEKPEMGHRMFGILLNVIFIVSGGCEAIFFRTVPLSVYLMVLGGCIAKVNVLHKHGVR